MRGNAQPYGRPLGGSELRSYIFFRRLWTKVHRIKFVCAGVSKDIREFCEIAPKF